MAGGMRGIDVQRVEASAVNEDKQDIEDAAIQSSVETVDSCTKKLVDLQFHNNKSESSENIENESKSVMMFGQQLTNN